MCWNTTGQDQEVPCPRADKVTATVDLADNITSWTPILGDLYTFGCGGDTILHTMAKYVAEGPNETLHVLATDRQWNMTQ